MAMDAKEIEAKAKALSKAATSDEPPAVILSLLKEIQTGVRATEDLLRQTRIGIIVNKFKQSKTPEIARLSSGIVSKWRTEVNKQKQSGATAASRGSSGSPRPAQTGTGASTPASAVPSDKASKLSVAPDKRTWKADGVNVNHSSNKTRANCTGLMYDGLCYGSTEPPEAILACAIAVETAAFKHLGPDLTKGYGTKIRSLFQNLKNKSNPQLRTSVLKGDISPDDLVRMSSDELRSDAQREKDAKYEKDNMNNAMVAKRELSISKTLQCGKCGQRKVTYTEAQTRAADEPMTLFCTCTHCGKSWRQ